VGLLLGLVGIDAQTGAARLTFGVPQLLDGLDVVLVAAAFFAVGETLFLAWQGNEAPIAVANRGSLRMSREDWRRSWPAWLRGTAIGFPMGALPAGGAELPTLLSFGVERRLTRYPEEFGHGAIEGVAGPEAANNASAAGTLVPLLALGVPTTATAAVLLAAFQQYGLQPGPLLFQREPQLVWGLLASLLIANVMLLVLNLPLVGVWARMATLRPALLHGGILVLATVGTYAIHRSPVDLMVLFTLGALACAMRVYAFPVVPVVIGALLGPLAEQHLIRALAIAEGRWSLLVTRPIAGTLFALAAATVLVSGWRALPRPSRDAGS
jgi:putative tricarboxylic transport membrane protein